MIQGLAFSLGEGVILVMLIVLLLAVLRSK